MLKNPNSSPKIVAIGARASQDSDQALKLFPVDAENYPAPPDFDPAVRLGQRHVNNVSVKISMKVPKHFRVSKYPTGSVRALVSNCESG